MTIKNQGAGTASGSFSTYFYKNLAAPPVQGQLPYDDIHTTFSLAPGATDSYTISGLTSQFAVPWRMYAYVDATNLITNETNEANNTAASPIVMWTSGLISVSGQFLYDDALAGANQPIRCIRVQLWDEDPGGNPRDLMAETYTDAQGNFGPVNIVNQDSDVDQGRLDLYIEGLYETSASCRATSAVTVEGSGGTRWFYDSARRDDITSGAFGTIKPTGIDHRSALHIYNTTLRGYDWVTARGSSMPQVRMQWFPGFNPGVTGYNPTTKLVSVSGAYADVNYPGAPDELDDGVLLHEYGHHILLTLNSAQACPGLVGLNAAVGLECAWSEGWSDYFAGLTTHLAPNASWRNRGQNSASAADTTVLTVNLETGVVTYRDGTTDNVNEGGEQFLVSVGGALWDIFDTANDNPDGDACSDQIADGFQSSWNIVASHPGVTVDDLCNFRDEFWRRYLNGQGPGPTASFNKTMCEHGVVCGGQVAVETDESSPSVLSLERCQPNPFRAATQVFFSVPAAAGHVRLQVFDAAGHLVKTLVDGEMPAGQHVVQWDGRNERNGTVGSGVYFARLVGHAGTRASKMVFLQ